MLVKTRSIGGGLLAVPFVAAGRGVDGIGQRGGAERGGLRAGGVAVEGRALTRRAAEPRIISSIASGGISWPMHGAGGARDALVHQRAAEIVGAGVEA